MSSGLECEEPTWVAEILWRGSERTPKWIWGIQWQATTRCQRFIIMLVVSYEMIKKELYVNDTTSILNVFNILLIYIFQRPVISQPMSLLNHWQIVQLKNITLQQMTNFGRTAHRVQTTHLEMIHHYIKIKKQIQRCKKSSGTKCLIHKIFPSQILLKSLCCII